MLKKKQNIKIFFISLIFGAVLTLVTTVAYTRYGDDGNCGCYHGVCKICMMFAKHGYPYVIYDIDLTEVNYLNLALDFGFYLAISLFIISVVYFLKNRSNKK